MTVTRPGRPGRTKQPKAGAVVALFHFTSKDHLPYIVADGFLKTVESNLSRRREHAGPDVVWLTTSARPARGTMGLAGSRNNKYAVRFTVELDRRSVHQWHDWARAHGIDRAWMAHLAKAGGSSSWRVVEHRIPRESWVEIWDMHADCEIVLPG